MSRGITDRVGQRYGRLVVVERYAGSSPVKWLCQCDCGNKTVVTGGNLQSGGTGSCGCYRKELKQQQMQQLAGRNAAQLDGRRFGKLVVIRRETRMTLDYYGNGHTHWLCQCDCGEVVVKRGKYLMNGDTKSCGCDQRAMRAAGNPQQALLPKRYPREYAIWRSMKSRCYVKSSSNYRFYGRLGVKVCERWRNSFVAFIADMGPRPTGMTIDRIDPFGDYAPDNCRWASWATQRENKRKHHVTPPS